MRAVASRTSGASPMMSTESRSLRRLRIPCRTSVMSSITRTLTSGTTIPLGAYFALTLHTQKEPRLPWFVWVESLPLSDEGALLLLMDTANGPYPNYSVIARDSEQFGGNERNLKKSVAAAIVEALDCCFFPRVRATA